MPPAPPPPPRSLASKLHFLLIPLPEQGHVSPMLCFASQLAALGCTVTFVKAEKAPLAAAAQPAVFHDPSLQSAGVKKDPFPDQRPLQGPKSSEVALDPSHTSRACVPSSSETTLNVPQSLPARLSQHQHTLQEAISDDVSADKDPLHCVREACDASASVSACSNGETMPLAARKGTNVRFWTLPYVGGQAPLSTDAASSRFEIFKHTLAGLEARQGMVEKLVQESKASNAPITCVIGDITLCSWVMDLARRQAVVATTLVPCSGVNFYLPYLSMLLGKHEESKKLCQRFGLPETKGPTNPEDIKTMAEVWSVFKKSFDRVCEASHVLVNSFKHLESALLESLHATELDFKFIGPCLPAWEVGDTVGEVDKIMGKQAGCAFTPDYACLSWLDKQEKSSVLFVSFGSEVSLEEEQVQELALGIEASGYKFLWVVRPDAPAHNLPQEEFRKRTSKVGMFISWVPQRKVLQHTAVGGFLTHCGWNSTLESMMCGVPMLCFPLNGDQFLNAQLIDVHWKVGLPLGPPRTLVRRAEIERVVRDLMGNHDLRVRIGHLKEAAHGAIAESQVSIASFVKDITDRPHQKSLLD